MADEKDAVKQYGQRIWGQTESVVQNLFAYYDRIGESYSLSDEERLQAVNRFLGEDFADWYRDWIEEGG